MLREIQMAIIKGKVDRDIYGSYEDCSPGLYIGGDKVDSVLSRYLGKNVTITIEETTEGID